MISSVLKTILCVLLLQYATTPAQSQTAPTKEPTGSISGKVTLASKGVSGIFVGARARDSQYRQTARFGTVTDGEGNYRLGNMPSGTYEVTPTAPQFVVAGSQWVKTLLIAEGETVEGVDFALVRGGVITGRVTDAEGQPLIEEQIAFVPEDSNKAEAVRVYASIHTDDRGVYRVFGLAPGRYKVSAGLGAERSPFGSSRRNYRQTFHPSVTDPAKATVIEVTEGSEARNVDITVVGTEAMFTVSGRIVDGDTGRPVPNVRYGLEKYREGGSSGMSGPTSNALGEFRFESVTPGKYAVFIERQPGSETYAEPVMFEVTDQNISDLIVKITIGARISGVLVFEGGTNKGTRRKFDGLMVFAYVPKEGPPYTGGSSVSQSIVQPDGSFTVGGLSRGVAQFNIGTNGTRTPDGFEIARIERDGVVQARGVEIKDREHVSGVRLVINASLGAVRGTVKIENGALPAGAFLRVFVNRVGEKQGSTPSPTVDSRGRFFLEGLKAGVYEVGVTAYIPNARNMPRSTKQQVIIVEDQVAEVTLTLNLSPEPEDEDDL
jgi:protocatechuate 3,4-dioxygenase beta subunit